jgi:hypothetical protein
MRDLYAAAVPLPKHERLAIFFRRLETVAVPTTARSTLQLIIRTLVEVEDAHSGVAPSDPPPEPPDDDGRMYPPMADRIKKQSDGSITARTRGHRLEIAADGTFRIYLLGDTAEAVVTRRHDA